MRGIYVLLFTIAMGIYSLPAYAVDANDEQQSAMLEIDEAEELLSILEEETEIATKTKMNADYVPGIVTVLHGEDLEALGARNVWQGLGFVPGIETAVDNLGSPLALTRGVGYGRQIGQYLIMLNSVPMTLTFNGKNDALLLIPIEQVERIEVVRGPGAALYGEFAYTFVVNVITRKEGNQINGRAGSYNSYGGSGLFSSSSDDDTFKISLNVAGLESDGADSQTGLDRLATDLKQPAISNSPGPANEGEALRSSTLTLSYKDFSLQFQGVKRNHGRYFGEPALPPNNGKGMEDQVLALEASLGKQVSSTLKADIRLGLLEDEATERYTLFPPGFTFTPPSGGGSPPQGGGPPPNGGGSPPTQSFTYPLGKVQGDFYKSKRWYGGLDFTWSELSRHIVLLQFNYSETELVDAWQEANFMTNTNAPLTAIRRMSPTESTWIQPGPKRKTFSLALQDQYQMTENFSITTGVRYDDFDDVGTSITPRIATVWRAGESHIFKLQYAQAYRPPTFTDLYFPTTGVGTHGNPNIKSETAATYEAGYIYRKPNTVGRVTVYQSNLNNMIVHGRPTDLPRNSEEIRLQGAELELEKKLGLAWKYTANISYMNTYNKSQNHTVGQAANHLGNLTVMYKFNKDLLLATRLSYVGDRDRSSTDSREALGEYKTVDFTASIFNLPMNGATLRIGAKNLFDEDIKAPSLVGSYKDDLPRPGISWWGSVSYSY